MPSFERRRRRPVPVGTEITEARRRLASTVFDATLRQLMAELYAKEAAAVVADRALASALEAIAKLNDRIAELERDLSAARARVETLSGRLDDLEGPRVVDIVAVAP